MKAKGTLVIDEIVLPIVDITLSAGEIHLIARIDEPRRTWRARPDLAVFAPDGSLILSRTDTPDDGKRIDGRGANTYSLPVSVNGKRAG